VAEALACFDDALPWDDVRRVIQGWCIARFRLEWGGVLDGDNKNEGSGGSGLDSDYGIVDEEESEDERM
jgi:hypothetical protein